MSQAWRIGYCTAGMQSHRLEDALRVLAEMGYRGVFLTLDVHHLDPFAEDCAARVRQVKGWLDALDLACVVETGARFLLDPRRKHQPTLLSDEGAARREALLERALEIAVELGAQGISTWSGTAEAPLDPAEADRRLVEAFGRLVDRARALGTRIGFEPEPGMWIETVADFHRLRRALGEPAELGLSLDCGHLLVTGEGLPEDVLRAEASHLVCVAIEDMKRGVHDHLPFGQGDLDLPPLIAALNEIAFEGVVAVELGRHSHEAVRTAAAAKATLEAQGVRFGA